MQMSIGLDRLKRFVCLLLIFVLLFCFFMCPRASAVAVEAATVAYAGALVGTILVGAGVIFSSHGDMQAVGAAMYKSWVKANNAIGTKIGALASWAVEHGEAAAKGALRVGKDLYQSIVDAFNSIYSNGKVSLGDGVTVLPSDATDEEISNFVSLFANKDIKSFYFSEYTGRPDEIVHHAYFTRVGSVYTLVVTNPLGGGETYERTIDVGNDTVTNAYLSFDYDKGSMDLFLNVEKGSSASYVYYPSFVYRGLSASLSPISVSVPQPDLKYPSDDYLVKMPDIPIVDTATGAATFPSDAAYTKDAVAVPYPVDTEGVKVPDIPYDKVVDQSTGKALDDTGTDTDNPSKPGEGTDTDKPSVNWPSAGDISLPKLIISKFPFCIPFDVARLIGLLEADPKTPIFHVPLKVGTILNEEIVLDLSQWDNAVRIIRWGELIVFVAGLVLVTRNYIKW